MLSFNSSNIASKTRTIGRRMFLLNSIKAVVLFGIFSRLASLQINEVKKYRFLADKNRFRETKFAAPRGIIKDYFDKEIASNTRIYQLHITPENTPNINQLLIRLKNLIGLSNRETALIQKKIIKQKKWETIVVFDNLTWSEFSRLNLFLHELEGARPIVSLARNYNNSASAHAIGYVSEISPKDIRNKKYLENIDIAGIAIGKTGLESSLDEKILGSPGFLRYEVNAYGKKIKQVLVKDSLKGKPFKTTLDNEIQIYAAKLLENVSGAACVMDIYNGDVVSMVSSPSFNPNLFVHGINQGDWNDLLKNRDKPMLNKAISGLYPPGSTIKILTTLSALENDVVSSKLFIKCKGYIDLHGQRFHCWKKKGHGVVGIRTALKKSCDVYFYEVARRLGIDRLANTAKKFGLGEKVLQNYQEEKAGVVPSTKWKIRELGKNWYIGETLQSGIGQGYFLTTPLQLCLMTAQIANGGFKIQPRILLDKSDQVTNLQKFLNHKNSTPGNVMSTDDRIFNFGLQPLFRNQENINLVKEAMFAASNEPGGTSYRSRHKEKRFMFAGKTGSSQIKKFTDAQRESEVKQQDIAYLDRDHAWFVAYAPVSDPRYAISVLIEHGGSGSKAAAPIASKIIKKVLERHQLRTSNKESQLENL